ncbi:hypothetical protein PRIPAC_95587 [Pristionchus pacificus]|uniref:Dehydrogenase n=1 Tax=Pristionchus pacificus TaxID=54126 RepID=A0A2A6D0R7_PRIPA|nr:hypothetical protein PRIPAC_95587 [Pristionchus pacificus]|eukprot:PDM84072.1 dehydrogenase [Pristionchus pacificus]
MYSSGRGKSSEKMKKSVFITGANRGIGLGLVKEFLKNDNVSIIIAGTRNLETSEALLSLGDDTRLHFVEIDLEKDETIKAAFRKTQIDDLVGDAGLDLLINNAGIHVPLDVNAPIDREAARQTYEVNVIGTLSVIQVFKPLLLHAVSNNGWAHIINISSIMASMVHTFGPFNRHWCGYSMSKAAVNMMTRTLSLDFMKDKIGVTAISPGWVKTDMGGDEAPTTVEESASGLAMFTMELGEEQNGKYYNYDSTPIDW